MESINIIAHIRYKRLRHDSKNIERKIDSEKKNRCKSIFQTIKRFTIKYFLIWPTQHCCTFCVFSSSQHSVIGMRELKCITSERSRSLILYSMYTIYHEGYYYNQKTI